MPPVLSYSGTPLQWPPLAPRILAITEGWPQIMGFINISIEWGPQCEAIVERVAIKRGSTVIRLVQKGCGTNLDQQSQNGLSMQLSGVHTVFGGTILKLLALVPWSVIYSTVSACVWVWVYYVYRDKGMWHALRVLAAFCARIQLCILCFGVTGGHWVVDKVCSRVF